MRTNLTASLIGLALAGGLAACQTMSGDEMAATSAGETASAAVALDRSAPSAGPQLSNPTNGGSAFVGLTGR